MATMNVSLPNKLKSWVEEKVADGDYASASDVVRDLVRQRMQYEARLAALREAIRIGDESGVSDRDPSEILNEVVESGRRRWTDRGRAVG
jgi:antitoxin ParD1/3/4